MTHTPDPTDTRHIDQHTRLARLALVVYWPLLFTATHWPSLSLTGKPSPPKSHPSSMLQGDKVGHLTTFALLAVLLILARPIGRKRPAVINLLAATAIALGYAVIDEVTQQFAYERTVSASDMVANGIAIIGVLLLFITPPTLDALPDAAAVRAARRRLAIAAVSIFLGGLLLSASGTINRETYAVHFFAGAAFALALLRGAPVWPSRPRLSVFIACAGVGFSVIFAEIVQAFSGLPFSHTESFYAHVGLLLAMSLWAARLARAGLVELAGQDDASDDAVLVDDESEATDPLPANPPRA